MPKVTGGIVHHRPAVVVRSPVSDPEVAVQEGRLDFYPFKEPSSGVVVISAGKNRQQVDADEDSRLVGRWGA